MRLSRKVAVNLLIASILGLIFIQVRLLVIGAKKEMQGFDALVQRCLYETASSIEEDNAFAASLGDLLVIPKDEYDTLNADSRAFAIEKLYKLLEIHLKQNGINTAFAFAITDDYQTTIFLESPNFDPKNFHFNDFKIELGESIAAEAYGQRSLHIDVPNLFQYLLWELDYLMLPSVLFFLMMVLCIFFLVNMLRKEERLNSVKNDFINNLTHELNTPVFSIGLATKLLEEQIEAGKIKNATELIKLINKENDKLKGHINKVLELASLERPSYQLELKKATANALIQELVERFELKVKERGGRLNWQLDATEDSCMLDEFHFKGVVQNLLDNALKYSQEHPLIDVRTQNINTMFQLTIADKGIGIGAQDKARIFEKFYRVSTQNKHEVKGFGLGLYYVKQIVEAHGGRIEVESKQGEGSIFIVTLNTLSNEK